MPPRNLGRNPRPTCPSCTRVFRRQREVRRHRCSLVAPLMSLMNGPQPLPPPSCAPPPPPPRHPSPPAPRQSSPLPPLPPCESSVQPSRHPSPPMPRKSSPPTPSTPRQSSPLPPRQLSLSSRPPSPPMPRHPSQLLQSPSTSSLLAVAQPPRPDWVCEHLMDEDGQASLRTPNLDGSQPSSTPLRPPKMQDAAVQADADWDPRQRARRRIVPEQGHFGYLRPVPSRVDVNGPRDHYLRVTLDEPRRLCDCGRCVRHATRLLDTESSAEIPTARGIRFVPLPGIREPRSTNGERQDVVRRLASSPQKTLVVCACHHCVAHRNFSAAWLEVRRLATPKEARRPPPEAGGCRDRPRD